MMTALPTSAAVLPGGLLCPPCPKPISDCGLRSADWHVEANPLFANLHSETGLGLPQFLSAIIRSDLDPVRRKSPCVLLLAAAVSDAVVDRSVGPPASGPALPGRGIWETKPINPRREHAWTRAISWWQGVAHGLEWLTGSVGACGACWVCGSYGRCRVAREKGIVIVAGGLPWICRDNHRDVPVADGVGVGSWRPAVGPASVRRAS